MKHAFRPYAPISTPEVKEIAQFNEDIERALKVPG